mgnify:CR=1 FL=1
MPSLFHFCLTNALFHTAKKPIRTTIFIPKWSVTSASHIIGIICMECINFLLSKCTKVFLFRLKRLIFKMQPHNLSNAIHQLIHIWVCILVAVWQSNQLESAYFCILYCESAARPQQWMARHLYELFWHPACLLIIACHQNLSVMMS